MTRVACVHCFTVNAEDGRQARVILRDLQAKINAASSRLDIGYQPGFINGQLQPELAPIPAIGDPERLFDDE